MEELPTSDMSIDLRSPTLNSIWRLFYVVRELSYHYINCTRLRASYQIIVRFFPFHSLPSQGFLLIKFNITSRNHSPLIKEEQQYITASLPFSPNYSSYKTASFYSEVSDSQDSAPLYPAMFKTWLFVSRGTAQSSKRIVLDKNDAVLAVTAKLISQSRGGDSTAQSPPKSHEKIA